MRLTIVAKAQLQQRLSDVHRSGVYFLEGAGLVKIGYSDLVAARAAELQSWSPVRLELLGYIPGATRPVERWFHERYSVHRDHGEWFRPTVELRQFVAGELPDLLHLCDAQTAADTLGIAVARVYELVNAELLAALPAGPRGGLRLLVTDIDAVAERVLATRQPRGVAR